MSNLRSTILLFKCFSYRDTHKLPPIVTIHLHLSYTYDLPGEYSSACARHRVYITMYSTMYITMYITTHAEPKTAKP